MDSEKWDRIVNLWYVPLNKKDENDREKYNDMLKKYNISNEFDIFSKPFYRQLKSGNGNFAHL